MKTPFELRLAARYLWAARKQAHTAFLSLISTVGVAVGVATLLISLALLSGLQGQIKERLIASGPQLIVEPRGSASIAQSSEVLRELALQQDVRAEAVVSGIAWAASNSGTRGRPVRIRSFQPGKEPPIERAFGREWKISAPPEQQILVTRAFAAEIGEFLGNEIVIVAPRMHLTPFGPVPVTKRFVISQLVVQNGGDENAPEAWLPFAAAAALFGTDGGPTTIEARTSAAKAEALKPLIETKFRDVTVKSWREINRPLFLALRLEKIVMFATISLIILVAALNLISSLSMVIVEKRPQVGILRTLGSTERSILGIFLALGLLIGLTGTLLGNIIGLGFSWAADRYGLVALPSDSYYLDHIPFLIESRDVLLVNLIAVVLSILATWYPARLASKLDPIDAIRDE